MYRTLLTRTAATSRFATRRAFSTARQPQRSNWVLPSSIIATGLATYLLTQPVALDAKKPEKKETTTAEKKETVKTQEAEETVAETPASEEKKTEEEKPEGEAVPAQSAAYNPETGEINWDCPCLGGMANGPCGEEFKEAFSCFIYSESEPKGFDCIEKFQNMQTCFRRYPEIYSEEIRGEDQPSEDFQLEDVPENVEIVILDDKVEEIKVEEFKADAPGAPVTEVAKEEVVPATETKSE